MLATMMSFQDAPDKNIEQDKRMELFPTLYFTNFAAVGILLYKTNTNYEQHSMTMAVIFRGCP